MKIIRMRCDYMDNPIGFDLDSPVFGWVVEAEGYDRMQSAYQLQIAESADFGHLVYDSGKVASDVSVAVKPEITFKPRTPYHWRVRVWDEAGQESNYSAPATFETARGKEPWQAKWIGRSSEERMPQLRKSFVLKDQVLRARAYVSGLGMYCLFLNGNRVGEDVLTPFINAYDQWIQYQTYDITDLLVPGENAIGAWLGNGYYAGRVNWPGIPTRRQIYGKDLGLIAEVVITYRDGREERILTDESWKISDSPLLRSEIYDGEHYDARLYQDGWNCPGYDDRGWHPASLIKAPEGKLQARRSPPLKVMETLPCRQVITTPKGETILDFGQNISGWVRLRVTAPSGTEILLQAGEVLDKEGNFYRDNMRTALAEQRYICKGGGEEYAPFMTFMGFRYMKLSGVEPETIRAEDFVAEAIYSAMETTGHFECSDERVNRLFLNALWSQKDNFVDVPTDCPQRDERMGWTGDAQVFAAAASMNMETDAFYRKYLYDLMLEQRQTGYVPVVVPNFLRTSGKWSFTTTGWADAAVIMPWVCYLYFGDKEILAQQYESMKGWLEYMRSQDTEGNNRYGGDHLGDWLAQDTKDPFNNFGATPTDLIATGYYAYSARIVAKTAMILKKADDAERYTQLHERVRDAFRREYLTPNGRVLSETQTAQVLTLFMELFEQGKEEVIVQHLEDRLHDDGLKLTTGFIGTPYLCPMLSEHGLNEYAYHLLLSAQNPSWLYAVERGATTIWERWNGIAEDGSFGPVSMNSFNHYAYGSIVEWMYRYVCGINPLESAPGFKRILLKPKPNSLLTHAKARVRSQYGLIESSWELKESGIRLEFTIPFNTSAEMVLPDAEGCAITENGEAIENAALIRGSGTWVYEYVPNGHSIHKRIVKREPMRI